MTSMRQNLFLCIEWLEEHCYAKVGKRVATTVHSWSSMTAALQGSETLDVIEI